MPLRPDFKARAILVADRIDLRGWKAEERMASNPLVVAVPGGGAAVLFRYGAAVFFDVMPEEESGFLARLARLAAGPLGAGETEEVEVSVDPRAREGMQGGRVLLAGDDVERLQIVADVLSKSVVLAYYESQVAGSFERVEPLAQQLEREGRIAASPGEISRHIGAMLLTGHTMVGRAAVAEKPELLWEHPELEGCSSGSKTSSRSGSARRRSRRSSSSSLTPRRRSCSSRRAATWCGWSSTSCCSSSSRSC